VKYQNIDLSNIPLPSNVERIVEIDCPNGNRGITLFTGLQKLQELHAEFFAVLDDDDLWLSNHMESLFLAAKQKADDFDVIFSGSISMEVPGREIEKELMWKRHIHSFGYRSDIRSINDVTREFCSNCFVARTKLLPREVTIPEMETAEDSLLISLVVRRRKPIFSYQATAFHTLNASSGSGYQTHQQRDRDELSWHLRSGLLYSPDWLNQGSISPVLEVYQSNARSEEQYDKEVVAANRLASADLEGLFAAPHWTGASVSFGDPTIVETVNSNWGYSAMLPLTAIRQMHQSDDGCFFWEIEAEVHTGEVGVGLIDNDQLIAEQLIKAIDGHTTFYLPAAALGAALLVRNGAIGGTSRVAIYGVRLIQTTRSCSESGMALLHWANRKDESMI
jgi:hypothetical protein